MVVPDQPATPPPASAGATTPMRSGWRAPSGATRCSSSSSAVIPMRRSRATSGMSLKTLRRLVDREIADRRLDAPDRHIRLQVARVEKALEVADAAIEAGDVRAVSQYLKAVAALDRYHGVAAALALPSPSPPRPLAALQLLRPGRAARADPRRCAGRGRGRRRSRLRQKRAPKPLKGLSRVTDVSRGGSCIGQ